MDKSWIQCENKLSKEYTNGVNSFISVACDYLNNENKTHCPCTECVNFYLQDLPTLKQHLWIHGFSKQYVTWTYHGEAASSSSGDDTVEDDINLEDNNQNVVFAVNDAVVGGYPETNQDETHVQDEYNQVSHKFNEILEEAKKELYPGCSKMSSLRFIVEFMHCKVLNGWSINSFDMALKLFRESVPENHRIPENYRAAKRMLRDLGLGYQIIHVCPNSCVLFRKQYKDDVRCPVCHAERYKFARTKGKLIPEKKMHYFPITPRLQRLFMSRHTSDDMRWHKEKRPNIEGELRHPADAEAWKHFDRQFPLFAEDPRNVRLGLATDGFNPFGDRNTKYSMWPVILIPYNMPSWRCMKQMFFIMALLIPGEKAPGDKIDVYLEPLVDELQDLWKNGARTFDVSKNEYFNMHAAIIWTINDFPAYGTISGWCTHGYGACPICNEDSSSFRIRDKISYMGHRRFLPLDHPWRKNRRYNGKTEMRPPPKIFSGDDLLKQLEQIDTTESRARKRQRGVSTSNWKRRSILWELEYWSKLLLRHNLDVMHGEKNICENLYGTLLCIEGKTKDTTKSRLDLADMKIRKELHLQERGGKFYKPPACYELSLNDRRKFCEWLKSVKFPNGYAANISRKANTIDGTISGLKSHDCHILLQRLLPVGLRPYMKKEVISAISELSMFFQKLCAKTLYVKDLDVLEEGIIKCLCKLESIFPPSFFTVMVHIAVHLPHEAKLAGPVHTRWMYPFERALGTLKKYVKNKARPEGSIAEGYVINEALNYCAMYLHGVDTRFSRAHHNSDHNETTTESTLSVFSQKTRLLKGKRQLYLEDAEYQKAHWYILNNCPELQPYIDEHADLLRSRGVVDIISAQASQFSIWFIEKIKRQRQTNASTISDSIYALACMPDHRIFSYNRCAVNGVRYNIKSHDKRKSTQNSGIWVDGEHNGKACEFYGFITDIWELIYVLDHKAVLFKCEWYNTDDRKNKIQQECHITSVNVGSTWYKSDPFILASQANQVFYLRDDKLGLHWNVAQKVHHRHLWDIPEIPTEHGYELGDDDDFSEEAYQEENSYGVNLVFDDMNAETNLSRGDAEAVESYVVDIELPIDDYDDDDDDMEDEDEDEDEDEGVDEDEEGDDNDDDEDDDDDEGR